MRPRQFDDAHIAYLRQVSVMVMLDALGIYWKRDATLEPLEDRATVRVHVSLGGAVIELLAIGPKWYDTQIEQGGGDAVDLAMYLLRPDLVSVVKRLQTIPAQPSAIVQSCLQLLKVALDCPKPALSGGAT